MRMPGFIGPSYTLQSKSVDAQRCVNLYLELNELGTGKEREPAALIGTPGLRTLLTLPTSPVRGVYTASNGELFAVGGNKLYRVSSAWVETELGTLNTSTGPVSMADNGLHVVIVDGDNGYAWTLASSTFAEITDEDFLGADTVTYQDKYFLFNKPDTQDFYFTGLNSVDFDALDFAEAPGGPDDVVGVISDTQTLFVFGTQTTEAFYNSGDADNPFQRQQGAVIRVGCAAVHSIQLIQGMLFWLGQDDTGAGIVYRAQGFQPSRISTHAIETVISGLIRAGNDMSSARAWTYQQAGHAFYCLNLPGATSTWCFDTSTNLWHERASLVLGNYQRHRADCHAYAHGTNVVGDYESGKLYALDPDTFTDAGEPLRWERAAPHITKELRRVCHSRFQLDMETGVGTDGTGQGVNPKVILQWSDDGGYTWSNEREASIGRIGARLTRSVWNRLGSSRDRVYRVRGSDPAKRVLIGADLLLAEGTS